MIDRKVIGEIVDFLNDTEANTPEGKFGVSVDDLGGVQIRLEKRTYNFTPEQKALILEELERRLK